MGSTSTLVLELLQGARCLEPVGTDGRAAQGDEMGTDPQLLPDVPRDRADVGAARAAHRDVHVVTPDLTDDELLDAHGPRLELDLLAGPHALVGPPTVDLDRRDGRRDLLDLADEAGQRRRGRRSR